MNGGLFHIFNNFVPLRNRINMTHMFNGAGVALITPFKEDHSIDFDALEQLVEEQISSGIDYLVALGTTAENPTLSPKEQKKVVDCVKSVNDRRKPIVMGLGSNNTYELVERIKDTNFNGIDGMLSVTPYYNKPKQQGLIEHFKLVAKASPIPVILYNVPSRTGVNMLAETSIRIAEACPNVVAIKEAAGEMSQISSLVKNKPDHFAIISGDDMLAMPTIAVGGVGVISVAANAMPGLISHLVWLANNGKFDEAQNIHGLLVNMFKLLFREGSPGGVKALMEIQGKCQNILRLPSYPVSEELRAELKAELNRILEEK